MRLADLKLSEKEIDILKARDLITVEALIRKEPLHYYDFTKSLPLDRNHPEMAKNIKEKHETCIIGTMSYITKTFKNKRSLIKIRVKDDVTSNMLFVNIMGQYQMFDLYHRYLNRQVIIGGYIEYSQEYDSYSMMNPIILSDEIEHNKKIHVVYGNISGIPDDKLRKKIREGIEKASALDFIPEKVLQKYSLPTFKESAGMMHFPKTLDEVEKSRKRAVFEDLLYMALKLELKKQTETSPDGVCISNDNIIEQYKSSLKYDLTKDQDETVRVLSDKIKKGIQVNALVQGDVGTGKTAVAICLLLQTAYSGYQAALTAPYTTLAEQHYREISEIAEKYGIKTVLLTSETKAAEKKKVLTKIASGEAGIVIGTHSIFSSAVNYKNLALIVTDEEHKFGVFHRENFKQKAMEGFHQVIMSATPIPRTLAQTIYGDSVEVMTILTKPAGRIPIQTAVCRNDATVMNFILKQVHEGHQAYVVCPSIEKGRSSTSVEEKEKIYREFFEQKGIKIGILTGKTKGQEKQQIMDAFRNNEIQILMATTVIEVGINVPNATCIAITGAERFGFSTLHQLRGRVGRGNLKSYCILQTDNTNEKLEYMCEETDGFKIAMKDLELRGPGSLFGEKQSGNDYYVKLMLTYPNMYKKVKEIAAELCLDNTGCNIVEIYEKLFIEQPEPDIKERKGK